MIQNNEQQLTLAQAAEVADVTVETIHMAIADGRLNATKVAGVLHVTGRDLMRYTQEPPPVATPGQTLGQRLAGIEQRLTALEQRATSAAREPDPDISDSGAARSKPARRGDRATGDQTHGR